MNTIEGDFSKPIGRFAIIASRFNGFIVESLIGGAHDTLTRHAVIYSDIDVIRVPGAWELPLVVERIAKSSKSVAVIALSCVIRGATSHYEFAAGAALQGLAHAQHVSRVPIRLGVLTTETIEQAVERAGIKTSNKGSNAALAAIEWVNLLSKL